MSSPEPVARKFQAAWVVFSRTCAPSAAPEATYQAWFAHYLISQFGIDRVAREPIFKHRDFSSEYRQLIPGGEVKLDAVITRRPGIEMPHYAHRHGHASGIDLLSDLAVISELKVSSTQGEGLDHTEVCRDFWKLSMLLDEADRLDIAAPLAFVCVLDNHPRKRYNLEWLLDHRLAEPPADDRVVLLHYSTHDG